MKIQPDFPLKELEICVLKRICQQLNTSVVKDIYLHKQPRFFLVPYTCSLLIRLKAFNEASLGVFANITQRNSISHTLERQILNFLNRADIFIIVDDSKLKLYEGEEYLLLHSWEK